MLVVTTERHAQVVGRNARARRGDFELGATAEEVEDCVDAHRA